MIYFFFRVVVVKAHSDGSVSNFVRQTYRQKNVRRVKTARCAGRTGRRANTVHIKHKQYRLTLYILKRNIESSGK